MENEVLGSGGQNFLAKHLRAIPSAPRAAEDPRSWDTCAGRGWPERPAQQLLLAAEPLAGRWFPPISKANRLPREVVDAPSLEPFKIGLDGVLSNLIWLKMSLLMAGVGLGGL